MTERDKLAELLADYYGVDPAYYGVDAYGIADHFLANGVTIQKWIPVSERLPEKDGFALVYTIDQIVGEAILLNRKEFYWAGSDDDAEPIAVTHWMPLPEPPKEV